MRRLPPVLSLALALFAVGCENVQSPAELAIQTRDALDVLPAGADVVGMFNAERARASDAFEAFSGDSFSMRQMGGESAARFNDLVEATGFDPDEDLRRVYFAASERPAQDGAPAFVVYADYDRDRLDAYVDGQPDLELERATYADVPVYVTAKHDHEMAFALVNDDMMVAGSRDEVYAMLDRLADGTKGLSTDAAMMALIRRASHPDDLWVAMRDLSEHHEQAGDDAFGQAGRMMQDAVLSVGFRNEGFAVEALGLTRPGVDTKDVASLVRGAVATMKMSAKSDRAALDALDRVNVREVRGGVEVETFIDQAALRTLRDRRDA